MGIHIIGSGGQVAEVLKTLDDVGRLQTDGIAHTPLNVATEVGKAFSWSNVTYDYAALDTVLLVQNISTTENLYIVRMYISGDTSTEVIAHCPVDVSPTGTAVVGVNLNRTRSALLALATAIGDETDNTQANVVWRGRVLANTVWEANLGAAVRLGYLDNFGVDFTTDGAACNVTILGYYY